MAAFQRLFKHTFIYGLATVLPRMFSFLLVPLYTSPEVMSEADYGTIIVIYAYFILFNVILAYGMETAFFRFYHNSEKKKTIMSTSGWSLLGSSVLILGLTFMIREHISAWTEIPVRYISLVIGILLLDALVIIPFAYLRAREKATRYAVIKILNVLINLSLNLVFLLWLGNWAGENDFWQKLYIPDFEISYVLIANLVASGATLLLMLPFYFKLKFSFDPALWKNMMRYAIPVLIAGVAFSINEAFDKILLDFSGSVTKAEIGAYGACYKLAVFMTLFATAFRLGIEPFFFSHASSENARETYATITKYFVVFGSIILVTVMVFLDFLKELIIRDETYWEAMSVVPLILLANLCLGIYHNLSVWYKITDRTKFGAYISVAGAVLTIALNFALIPILGYFGSAIATLAAYFSMMLLSYYYGQKHYPIPYDVKKITGYLTLSIGFSVLSFYVFPGNYFVGISLLLLFSGTVFFGEKNELKQLIKK